MTLPPNSPTKGTNAEQVVDHDRFWAKVDVRGPDDCWLWNGARNSKGYGNLMWRGRRGVRATHVSLELADDPRPATAAMALHSCDNPPCVNPAHLRWGGASANARDALERGRLPQAGWQKHETHCPRGHEYPPRRASGRRFCLACEGLTQAARRRRVRGSPLYIAHALTKAQRAMLLACPTHQGNADKRTAESLQRRGLIEPRSHLPNPHMAAWPYPAFSATPLGLEVRAILEGQQP